MNDALLFLIENIENKGLMTFSAEVITILSSVVLLRRYIFNHNFAIPVFISVIISTVYMVSTIQFHMVPSTFYVKAFALILVVFSVLKYSFLYISYNLWYVEEKPVKYLTKTVSLMSSIVIICIFLLDDASISMFLSHNFHNYVKDRTTLQIIEYIIMFFITTSIIKIYYHIRLTPPEKIMSL